MDIVERTVATDPHSDVVSHQYFDQLATEEDVQKIVNPTIVLDEEATARAEEKAHEMIAPFVPCAGVGVDVGVGTAVGSTTSNAIGTFLKRRL